MDSQPGVTGTSTTARPMHGGVLLLRGKMLCVEDGRETLVLVRSGRMWITQERESRDVVLEAGQDFRISRDGCTLIEALRDSEIDLVFPDAQQSGQCIDLLPRRPASSLLPNEPGGGLRSKIAVLGARLIETWLGLYARPPGRARQIV